MKHIKRIYEFFGGDEDDSTSFWSDMNSSERFKWLKDVMMSSSDSEIRQHVDKDFRDLDPQTRSGLAQRGIMENMNESGDGMRMVWKRPNKQYGKSAIGHDNELRDWQLFVNAQHVITLSNWGALTGGLRGDNVFIGWRVMLRGNGGPNVTLKQKFETKDIEEAKQWCEEFYKMMANLKDDAPQHLKDLKAKMTIAGKPVARTGDFKKVLPILRAKLQHFHGMVSTNTAPPNRRGRMTYDPKTFNETGEFEWVDTRYDPKEAIEKLKDALAPEFDVEYTKGSYRGTVKIIKAQ